MNITASPYADQKRANRALSIEEYANGCVELESRPRALFVELTQGCNLTCPRVSNRTHSPSHTPDVRCVVRSDCEDLASSCRIGRLAGMESLILPEAMARIETVRSYGAAIRVVTNLSFRRDKVLDVLVDAEAVIEVSLDSASPDILEGAHGSQLDLITTTFGASSTGSAMRAIWQCSLRCREPRLRRFRDLWTMRLIWAFARCDCSL